MLTSPQSIINCSFQMCQRGKGLLGKLERGEGKGEEGGGEGEREGREGEGRRRGRERERRPAMELIDPAMS